LPIELTAESPGLIQILYQEFHKNAFYKKYMNL